MQEKRYWSDLKIKLQNEVDIKTYDKIVLLKLVAKDRKLRNTNCANFEETFREI